MTEYDESLAPPESQAGILQRQQKRHRELAEAQAKRDAPDEEQEARRYDRRLRSAARRRAETVEQLQREEDIVTAMSPDAKAEHFANQARSIEHLTRAAPRFDKGEVIALQDLATDERKAAVAEREAAEAKAGVPRLEADHAQRLRKIRETTDAELRELDQRRQAAMARRRRKEDEETERHHDALQAARESLEEAPA